MTAGSGQPSPEDDWIVLDEACRIASREKIAAWCGDGVVRSRAGLRVLRIRHLDIGTNETISEENVPLDPADWSAIALGNLRSPHWLGSEIGVESRESSGLPFGLFMSILGGTLYWIQVHRADLDRMLATAPPKKRAGRPAGSGYREIDKPIVEKMRAGLVSGKFKSVNEAGMHFADEAEGKNTTPESKAKRLAKWLKPSE